MEEKVEPTERERLRRLVYDWMRDDLGITAKMGIYPSEVEKLLDRLERKDHDREAN